jgi:signal transduction histidine kinase
MSVDRLARFSEAALLVTSFKVSRPGLARKRMPIATLFAICVNECAQRLEAKKITVTTSVNPGTITVAADPGLIKKCLHHILLNSIKYVHEGGFISLNAVAAGTEIVITIADDGPGLSENARSFLYELFSSGDIQHHSEGFGLGLATARMIMEAHGGSIEVREGEKGGVLVTLTLPSFDDTACDALQG